MFIIEDFGEEPEDGGRGFGGGVGDGWGVLFVLEVVILLFFIELFVV